MKEAASWQGATDSRSAGPRGQVGPTESPRPSGTDPSGLSRIGSSKILVCTIFHIELCIIKYLHMSNRI
jgi:hypothetical protein